MKRTKAPASTPTSLGHAAQVPAKSEKETDRTETPGDKPAVPLALSYDAPQSGPKREPLRRTALKRCDVPAILFEADDVKKLTQAEATPRFSTGSGFDAAGQANQSLPESYGTGRLLLTARDPKCLYAHWDLTQDQQQRYSDLSDHKQLTLRVHQENLAGPVISELPISPRAHHCFIGIDAPRARRFAADLGYYPTQGPWETLATAESAAAAVPYSGTEPVIKFATLQFAAETKLPASSTREASLSQPSNPAAELVAREGFPLPKPLARSGAAGSPRETAHGASVQAVLVRGQPAFGPESLGDVEEMLAEEFEAVDDTTHVQLITELAGSWTSAQESALAELIGWSSVQLESYASADIINLAGAAPQVRVARPAESVRLSELELSSAGMAAAPDHPEHGFWFNVNAELVIYGATEPDAVVTLGDRPIQLRPDGSFSCRFALPDGGYPLALSAASSRGERREAKLHVSRETQYSSGTGVHPVDSALRPPSPG